MANNGHQPVPPLEWAAAAFGLLVVLILVAIIGRAAVMGGDQSAPVLVAEVQRVESSPAGRIVEFRVRNLSGRTAASVQVEGRIKGAGTEETSSATLDYVPGRSQTSGGLVFPGDSVGGSLELRVTGYELP